MSRNLAILAAIFSAATSAHAQTSAQLSMIRDRMRDLGEMVGCWTAATEVRNSSGLVAERGTYHIRWMLDSTYMEIAIDLLPANVSTRRRVLSLLTFDRRANRYRQVYFHPGTLEMVEDGEWASAEHVFRTTTVIPKMDGKRDFHIRTEMRPSTDSVTYRHFSHYTEEAEQLEMTATLRRAPREACG